MDVTRKVEATGDTRGGRPGRLPGRAGRTAGPGEGAHPGGRRDRRRPAAAADGRGGPGLALIGPDGPVTLLEAFEGRRQLIAYYFMWHAGQPAAEQCEGCTWCTSQVARAVLPALPRHHLRCVLPGSLRARAAATATSWAGTCRGTPRSRPLDAAARRAPDRHDAPRLLPAGRRPGLRDLLDHRPRGRGDGQQLRADGPHRLRPPGGLGGLARRLAAAAGGRRPQQSASTGGPSPSGPASQPAAPTTSARD